MYFFLFCALCFSCNCVYCYAVPVRCSASGFCIVSKFCVKCFDASEVTTRKGNESIVQKENCLVEEIKEVELRSLRGKFIYNTTYNFLGLNQVSPLYFRHDKLP